MNQINKYLNSDPFKIARADNTILVRNINLATLAIFFIVALNILFFFIIYATTYYSQLDEIEEINKEYREKGQLYFDNMHIGLKIMPSYNTENNVIFMDKVNDYKRTRIKEALSLMERYNMNYSYYFVNKTELVFPKLDYKQEAIPVGNSITMCFNLAWAEVEKGRHFDLMKEIKNFPQCEQSKSGAFIWNEKDSTYGMDIPVWVQHEYEIDCANEKECDYYCEQYYNAEFVNGKRGKKCYSYEVLSAICLAIEFNPTTNEWLYAGGCFKNNKNYLLEPAIINNIYNFSGVEIEIRNKRDPIIQAGIRSYYTYKFGAGLAAIATLMKFLFYLAILGAIGLAVLIFLEKNKKPSNPLLGERKPDPQPEPEKRNQSGTEQNLNNNQNASFRNDEEMNKSVEHPKSKE